jgi:hypothetical protein
LQLGLTAEHHASAALNNSVALLWLRLLSEAMMFAGFGFRLLHGRLISYANYLR